ncbi:MAG: M48 family metallopeptidase [Gammaproteobacteria bacterium]|nr:M48 family metallopeptidase [Gammaproteobacteria bacterium]MCP5425500.1 M48 family metallopeptidase [Gammaproteobacteria bacterium]MCP5459380.1 M48 family metallopeptidase [Gammaproteobacteria bacterium]
MELSGHYFPPGRSQRLDGILCVDAAGSWIVMGDRRLACDLRAAEVSERVARMPRSLTFADGGRFDTQDERLDEALIVAGHARASGLVHRLENRWLWALLALALTPALVFGLMHYGFPLIAKPLSAVVPPAAVSALDAHILEILDDHLLTPSELDDSHRERAARVLAQIDSQGEYRLLIRKGGALGANALALPAGALIVTDELLEQVEQDGELLAVLAHEIGHVRERHSVRQILQTAGVALTLSGLFGDLNGVTDTLLVSLPTVLQQLAYSRDFEREADAHALRVLAEQGVSAGCYASILGKLEASQSGAKETDGSYAFLSSHPGTAERVGATGSAAQECGRVAKPD